MTLASSKSVWGFITGERVKTLKAALTEKLLTFEEADKEINSGNEQAIGVGSISTCLFHLIKGETDLAKAYKILEEYCKKSNVRSDGALIERLSGMKLSVARVHELMEEFENIKLQTVDAGILIPDCLHTGIRVNSLPAELDTLRQNLAREI